MVVGLQGVWFAMVVGLLLANEVDAFPNVATQIKSSLRGPHDFKRGIAVKQVIFSFTNFVHKFKALVFAGPFDASFANCNCSG